MFDVSALLIVQSLAAQTTRPDKPITQKGTLHVHSFASTSAMYKQQTHLGI
jgi:hypothetical protein